MIRTKSIICYRCTILRAVIRVCVWKLVVAVLLGFEIHLLVLVRHLLLALVRHLLLTLVRHMLLDLVSHLLLGLVRNLLHIDEKRSVLFRWAGQTGISKIGAVQGHCPGGLQWLWLSIQMH